MNPDSLYWDKIASRNLPTDISNPTSVGCVEWRDAYYCLSAKGTEGCMAVAENAGDEQWATTATQLPEGTQAHTLTACGDHLYLLASNTIYQSSDAVTWESTGVTANHIYGSHGNLLLANVKASDGTWRQIVYPTIVDAETAPKLPDGCPVSGTSNTVTYSTDWSSQVYTVTAGGRTADGELTGSSWAFDGNEWMSVSIEPGLPREGMVLVPYFAYRSEEYWSIKKYSVLLAFCGTDGSGTDNTVYISYDLGVHWETASTSMQLPSYIYPYVNASAVVCDTRLHSRGNSVWKEYAPLRLPDTRIPAGMSRSASLITEWECPYIYLFGGYASSGSLNMIVWRGVVNRLTFQPLQ